MQSFVGRLDVALADVATRIGMHCWGNVLEAYRTGPAVAHTIIILHIFLVYCPYRCLVNFPPPMHWQQTTYRDGGRSGIPIYSDGGNFGRLFCSEKQGFALWGNGSLMFSLSLSPFPTVLAMVLIAAAALGRSKPIYDSFFVSPSTWSCLFSSGFSQLERDDATISGCSRSYALSIVHVSQAR